jgi:pimeloyl-ACP methyl ester carboxylesterase
VLIGHSAGGHLALWAAARPHLPPGSPLYIPTPIVPNEVISLAGIGDLRAFAPLVPLICGPGILERLTNGSFSDSGDIYAEASPAALPALKMPVVMISGILDGLVPPYVAHDYVRALQDEGAPSAELVNLAEAGHFDLVTPGTPAWAEVSGCIEAALGLLR